MLSVAMAHPTDVVKVRMQAQFGNNLGRYANSSDAYKKVYTKEGMKGLWRGKKMSSICLSGCIASLRLYVCLCFFVCLSVYVCLSLFLQSV